jgi:Rad3-related DNA helicase
VQAYHRASSWPPLPYSIYVADIPWRPGIEISQFADDTAACTSNKNKYSVSNLQRYMSDLESLLYKWKMKINAGNSSAVIFTKRRQVSRNRFKLVEQEIPWSEEAKYLSIRLERRLTWKAHIKAMENKAMQRFVSLCFIFKSRTFNRKLKLIYTNH